MTLGQCPLESEFIRDEGRLEVVIVSRGATEISLYT